jgi:NAD(P)-dependent dehydrogenase (short-subunit alcohol dehydrogenase family)
MGNLLSSQFELSERVFVITGGGGLLGRQHSIAIAEHGGTPIILDIDLSKAELVAEEIGDSFAVPALPYACDITNQGSIEDCMAAILGRTNRIDGLINNAANNEKMEAGEEPTDTSLESFPLEQWNNEFAVGVTGSFLCSRVFGGHMAKNGSGVIVNISSDLGIISPDQRIYKVTGKPAKEQVYKPVSYSVIKHAVIGLTKYLATYWSDCGIRVNALCPGGIYSGQPAELVDKLVDLIPMGRMATESEYRGAIQFLCSDASSYMTGSILIIDGGRTAW